MPLPFYLSMPRCSYCQQPVDDPEILALVKQYFDPFIIAAMIAGEDWELTFTHLHCREQAERSHLFGQLHETARYSRRRSMRPKRR